MCVAVGDMSNCCHRLSLHDGMHRVFALKLMDAKRVDSNQTARTIFCLWYPERLMEYAILRQLLFSIVDGHVSPYGWGTCSRLCAALFDLVVRGN